MPAENLMRMDFRLSENWDEDFADMATLEETDLRYYVAPGDVVLGLLGGQQTAITKRGRIIALLVEPSKSKRSRKLDWKGRFGAPVTDDEPRTDVVGLLLREREESL